MNVHAALEGALERLAGVLEGARFEHREGYTFQAFPTFPVRDLNGMWVDSDVAAAQIEDARAEAEELGTPFGIMVREGRSPAVEDAVGIEHGAAAHDAGEIGRLQLTELRPGRHDGQSIGALRRHQRRVAAGEIVEVTDRGRPLARIVPIHEDSRLEQLVGEGRASLATGDLLDVKPVQAIAGKPVLSEILTKMRADER